MLSHISAYLPAIPGGSGPPFTALLTYFRVEHEHDKNVGTSCMLAKKFASYMLCTYRYDQREMTTSN
jgi:hypothetical protein